MAPPDLVLVGRVVKPQGRRGEVAVDPVSDRPDRFPTLRRAYLAGAGREPREVRIDHVFAHQDRFVLKISGVDSIDQAEELRGLEMCIPQGDLAELPEGSYYHHQLCGLRAVDAAGDPIGLVEDVFETGASAKVLVIRGGGEETLVPFAAPFVLGVDLALGSLVLRRPEYLVAD